MRKWGFLAFMLLFCVAQGLTLAQGTSIVRGRVMDKRGAPVSRVKVTIATKWGFTDSAGRYVLSRVPPGRYKVTLEFRSRVISDQQIEVKVPLTERDLKWPF